MSDNTASNLGTGQGIFAQKVGDDLQFKGLVGGTGVTLTADGNNITINSTGSTTAVNLGTGSGLFTSKNGSDLQFKTIIANADSGISLTSNTNDLTLQLVSANVDAGKLGGVAASDYLRKSDNLLSVASAATARTNLSVYSKAEIDANVVRNNQNVLPTTDSTWSLGSNSYKWLNIYADNFYGRASVAGSIGELSDIGNVDLTGKVQDDIIKYNAISGNWETGKLSFLTLSDTPANYSGAANKYVKVNSAGDGIEFVTGLATESYVTSQINAIIGGAPGALDTLNELAEALNDDADFHTSVTNSLATKEPTITPGTVAQYYRGDKTFQTLDSDAVAEGSTNKYVTASNMGTISIDALSDVRTSGSNAPSDGQALVWDNIGGYWKPGAGAGGGGGTGDITAVVAGVGLTGGASSGSATLDVDVGTGANKIVQLDGSGRLPAVDGSQLTGVSTATTIAALTDTTIGTPASGEILYHNGSAWVDQALTTDITPEGSSNLYFTNARADARITAVLIDEDNMASNSATRLPSQQSVKAYVDAQVASKDNTDEITEGSSNLYFTNARADARADARIAAASLTDLSNVDAVVGGDDGKILYYDHSSTSFKWKTESSGGPADTDALAEGSTNLYFTNARFDARLQTRNIGNLADVDTTGASNGQALVWSSGNSRWEPGTVSYTNFNTDFDTRLATKDTGDVAEGSNLYFTNARADARITAAGSANWNTAYSWGDHSTEGYLTSVPAQSFASLTGKPTTLAGYGITDAVSGAGLNALIDGHLNQSNPTAGYVLSWNGSDYAWVDNGTTGATSFTGLTDTPANYTSSANRFVKVNSAGNALEFVADPGYLTSVPAQSFASLTGKPTTIAGYGITDAFDGDYNNLSNKPTIPSAYSNADVDAHLNQSNPTAGYVLSWNGGDYAWISNSGYTNTDFDNRLATKTTANLTEGSNLYFTNARADARADVRIGAASLTDLSDVNTGATSGQVLKWNGSVWAPAADTVYTTFNTDFDTRLGTKTTDNLSEGSTNLYFADSRVDSRINAQWLVDEDNMASDSATKFPTQQSVKAYVDTQIAAENELSEANDVSITSVANNQFLKYNSSTARWENATVTPSSAAGSDTYVQFNDGGVMAGDAGFVYNKTTDALTVGSVTTTGSTPQVSAAGNLGISTTASNGNITFTPHGTGDVVLSANVKIDGSDNDYLKWTAPYSTEGDLPSASTYHGMFAHVHGTGKGYFAHGGNWIKLLDETSSTTTNLTEGTNLYYTDTRFDTRLSSKDTGDLTEGSNLYFTNARADARITAAGSANWNTAFGWGDHSTAGYLTSVPAQSFASLTGKPTTIAGYGITDAFDGDYNNLSNKPTIPSAYANSDVDAHLNQSNPTSGYVLSWNGSDYAWVAQSGGGASAINDLSDVTISSASSGQVLKYNGSAWVNAADAGGIALTDLSVGAEASASGNGGIAYNSGNGTFTYTPPTAAGIGALADLTGSNLNTLADVNNASPTDGQVLTWDNSNSYWKPATPSGGGSAITIQDEGSALSTAATTINFVGAGVTASGTGATKTITINGGGGGSGGTEYEEFKINYATNGNISTISDTSSGISNVNIDSAAGGDLTITFTGYTTPPLSMMFYGYVYSQNKYVLNSMGTTGTTLREIPGGGSAGSPTAFGSFSTMTIKAREAETGAARSFGTVTHAWVRFVMGA